MNTIYKLLLVLMFSGFAMNVSAQTKEKKESSLELMKKELNLSDEQVGRIQQIHESYANDKKALRAKMNEIRSKEKAEIEKILSPDQLKKLEALKEQKKSSKK